jgi:hypothetical protein
MKPKKKTTHSENQCTWTFEIHAQRPPGFRTNLKERIQGSATPATDNHYLECDGFDLEIEEELLLEGTLSNPNTP